jgi:hypothetical protein
MTQPAWSLTEIYVCLAVIMKGHTISTVFENVVVKNVVFHLLPTANVNVRQEPDRVFPDGVHRVQTQHLVHLIW